MREDSLVSSESSTLQHGLPQPANSESRSLHSSSARLAKRHFLITAIQQAFTRALPSSKKEAHLTALFYSVRRLFRPVPGSPMETIQAGVVSFVQRDCRAEQGIIIRISWICAVRGDQSANFTGIVVVSSYDALCSIFLVTHTTASVIAAFGSLFHSVLSMFHFHA